MINPLHIIQGMINAINPDEAVEAMAKERMDICNTCPEKTEMLGQTVCGVCHCLLQLKTRSTDSSCPLGKW